MPSSFSFIILLSTLTTLTFSKAFLEIISDTKDTPSPILPPHNLSSSVAPNSSNHAFDTRISDDNNNNDLTDNDELNAIIGLFSHSYFYGHWQTVNSSVIRGFQNRDGYVYLHYDTLNSFPLDMHLYDGNYIDGKVLSLLYHDLRQGAVYDNTTKTLTLIDVATTQQMGKMYGNFDPPTICALNITVHFLNIYTSQPYQLTDGPDQLGIQFAIQSNVCFINIVTTIMSETDQLFQSQVLPYSIIACLLTLSQCLLMHYFHKLIEKHHNLARRTSAWSIVILNGFDLYLFLSVSYFFMSYSPIFELGSIPSAVLAFCFEPKIIWKIIQHQRGVTNEASRPATEVKTYFCMLSLFLCVLASLVVFPDFSYFLGAIYMIPQIRHNFITSQRYRWNFWIICGLGFPKLLFLVYTKVDPNNLFRISPSLTVTFLCGGLLVFQLFILAIQTRWPRFGCEKRPVYVVSSYRESLSRQDVCAICLDKLKDSFGSSSPSPSFIGTDATLRDKRKILTPCKHEFHLLCLRQWLESKLECPYCRKTLPMLPEEYVEE